MESEFPPLPSSGQAGKPSTKPSQRVLLSAGGYRGLEVDRNGSKIIHKILSRQGDAILEYIDTDSHKSVIHYRWQVSSAMLIKNSPFFSALLDPNKFSEGLRFVENSSRSKVSSSSGSDESTDESSTQLPLVRLTVARLVGKHRMESFELFLKMLLIAVADSDGRVKLGKEINRQSVPVIAGTIEIADIFSSSEEVKALLKEFKYRPSIKGVQYLETFGSSLLKLNEERLRQIMYIAMFLKSDTIFRVASHTLTLVGSVRWSDNTAGFHTTERHRWSYFPNGIEEELYYRRQCIMNTITDLQAHFLRAYGALEDHHAAPPRPQTKNNMPMTAVSVNVRPLQCRWGFDNSKACDSFHLGEIIRFFSVRTRTIFLGSTLIDPEFENDFERLGHGDSQDETVEDENMQGLFENGSRATPDGGSNLRPSVASMNIMLITSSLRQIPDYQLDANHTGCGIRRRLLPLLDCIDGFICHRRALIGLSDVTAWKLNTSGNQKRPERDSWKVSEQSQAAEVDIRGAKIISIRKDGPRSYASKMDGSKTSATPNRNDATKDLSVTVPIDALDHHREEARFLFTAKKRNWEC